MRKNTLLSLLALAASFATANVALADSNLTCDNGSLVFKLSARSLALDGLNEKISVQMLSRVSEGKGDLLSADKDAKFLGSQYVVETQAQLLTNSQDKTTVQLVFNIDKSEMEAYAVEKSTGQLLINWGKFSCVRQ